MLADAQVLAGNEHTCALFRHVTSSQEELLSDHSGEVRGHIMQSVLKEASSNPQAGPFSNETMHAICSSSLCG